MRLVQALGSSGRGGAERFFIRLAKALHGRGIPQALLARRASWVAGQLSTAGIATNAAWFGGKFDLVTRVKYRQTLEMMQADIAIGWTPNSVAACPRGPWVRVGRLGRSQKLDAFASCHHLIANSPRIVADVRNQGWPLGRVSYIPNFVPEVDAPPARRSAFNTPQDVPLILWLGRMEPEKGPDLMIRALAQTPDAYLWMAGTGSFEAKVKALGASLGVQGRIRFLGWRDDIHALLRAADIFVRSSRDEGLGNVLEAWANGLPVISTRSCDADHLIAGGQSGLLVPQDDPAAIASALKALFANRDYARRLGEAGRSLFKTTFSEAPVVAMYLDLCHRLREEHVSRTEHPMRYRARPGPTFAR